MRKLILHCEGYLRLKLFSLIYVTINHLKFINTNISNKYYTFKEKLFYRIYIE